MHLFLSHCTLLECVFTCCLTLVGGICNSMLMTTVTFRQSVADCRTAQVGCWWEETSNAPLHDHDRSHGRALPIDSLFRCHAQMVQLSLHCNCLQAMHKPCRLMKCSSIQWACIALPHSHWLCSSSFPVLSSDSRIAPRSAFEPCNNID